MSMQKLRDLLLLSRKRKGLDTKLSMKNFQCSDLTAVNVAIGMRSEGMEFTTKQSLSGAILCWPIMFASDKREEEDLALRGGEVAQGMQVEEAEGESNITLIRVGASTHTSRKSIASKACRMKGQVLHKLLLSRGRVSTGCWPKCRV